MLSLNITLSVLSDFLNHFIYNESLLLLPNICRLRRYFISSTRLDVIIISSLHFGIDKNGKPNIYLNDNLPDDPIFDKLWEQTQKLHYQGVAIYFMIGGAGGAFKIIQ